MNHHLNQYYRDLQETAERHYREDLEAWAFKDEIMERALASSSHDSFTHSPQYNSPHPKQPIAESVRIAQEQEMARSVASCALYEKNRRETDEGEFESKTIHLK